MKERPILFSGPMVRAILDGRKTQTRRLLKHDGPQDIPPTEEFHPEGEDPWQETCDRGTWIGCNEEGTTIFARCPYGLPGDRLWVKETFGHTEDHREHSTGCVWYRADPCKRDAPGGPCEHGPERWRPSIFMPRWASRITLEVTSVRVERLQDITEADVAAEGIEPRDNGWKVLCKNGCCYDCHDEPDTSDPEIHAFVRNAPIPGFERTRFSGLWDSINGERAPWASNPWVWVIGFRRVEAGR